MKLLLCLRPCLSLGERIAADPALAAGLGHQRLAHMHVFKKWVEADSPLVERVLATGDAERPSFFRDMRFTAAELAACARLEVRTKVTVGQSPAAAEATRQAYQAEALRPAASGWAIRLPQRIFLSKPPAPATIAHVDQWTGEYVMDESAGSALRASGLTGWQLLPVWRPKTQQPEPGFGWHLSTAELLAPALRTYSAFEATASRPPEPPRRHGLVAYARADIEAAADFARTCEPWDAWDVPMWTVSQRARHWYEAQGLRGWSFRPLLEAGTRLHDEHEALWAGAIARVRAGGGSLFV